MHEAPQLTIRQSNAVIFWLVGGLHLLWGVGLLLWPQIAKVTAIYNVTIGVGPAASGVLMIVVGACAISSTRFHNAIIAVALLAAQQWILISSLVAVIQFAAKGQYADETPAAGVHIFFDQLVYVLIALAHTWAIIETHGMELIKRMQK